MIQVKVFGATPPCAKCKEVEKRAGRVAERYPGKVTVAKYDAVSDEGAKYGVMFTPAVAVNDRLVVSGELITEGELEKEIKRTLEGEA
jgi:thiol-disulfide isomerase/thioredoxin